MLCMHAGIVLLKNAAPRGSREPILPLNPATLQKLCVVGPLANSTEHMMGNYYGKFDTNIAATPLQGIKEALGECPSSEFLSGCCCSVGHHTL